MIYDLLVFTSVVLVACGLAVALAVGVAVLVG